MHYKTRQDDLRFNRCRVCDLKFGDDVSLVGQETARVVRVVPADAKGVSKVYLLDNEHHAPIGPLFLLSNSKVHLAKRRGGSS